MKWLKKLLRRDQETEDQEELEFTYNEATPIFSDPVSDYVRMSLEAFWTVEIIDPDSYEQFGGEFYGIFDDPTEAMKVLEVSLYSLNTTLVDDEPPWTGRLRSIFPLP